MNSNAIKADVPSAPNPAQVSTASAAPAWAISEKGLRWMAICATIGPLYFLGLCVGYLIFAAVLPEVRLAFLYGGLFALIVPARLIALWRGARPTRYSAMIYGLYAATVVIQIFWYVPIANAGGAEQYVTVIGDAMVASGVMAITGEALGMLWARGQMQRIYWRTLIPFAASLGTIMLGIAMGWDATAEMRLMFANVTQSGEVFRYNYLSLGDSVGLLGLLSMALVRTVPRRLILFVATTAGLFFAYSRTSFFLYVLCSVLVFLIGAKNSQKFGLAVAAFILVTVLLVAFSESELIKPAMERMAVLITDRHQDDSYLARQELMQQNLGHLSENWFLGRFMDEWWREGVGGSYIHNWLSFWQSYGIIPFLASLVIFGVVAHGLWLELSAPRVTTGAAMALFAYAMIAIVTSRAYTWPYLWLALGVVAAMARARTNENSVSSTLG